MGEEKWGKVFSSLRGCSNILLNKPRGPILLKFLQDLHLILAQALKSSSRMECLHFTKMFYHLCVCQGE